jgi:hypothetical protein
MGMIWQRVDEPSEEVMKAHADDTKTLLKLRAWEVKESPKDMGYKVIQEWPKLPDGWELGQVAGVAADSQGSYYLFHRGDKAPPLISFNRCGEVQKYWRKKYGRPHMAKCDEEDNLWLIDDGGHALYLYTTEGELLKTMGTPGVPGEGGNHFNAPTDIAFGVNGDYFITDGYGNRRVAHFDQDFNFIGQWGSEGLEEGKFVLPHAVTTDDKGLVYVADRNRWRVQIFGTDGDFIEQWTHIGKPFGIVYYEGFLWICDGTNARVTKVDKSGKVLGFFGAIGDDLGQLSTAHDISLAPNGDVLIGHLDGRAQLFTPE